MKDLVALSLLLSLLSPLACCAADAGGAAARLDYTLEPTVSGSSLRLNVDLSFTGDATGGTRLHLPSHFSGQTGLYRNVQNLRGEGAGVSVADTDEPDIKEVKFPPGQAVRLHYEVTADGARDGAGAGAFFRPALSPSYFALIGTTFWVYPAQYSGRVSVTLHWKMPPGWILADSLGAVELNRTPTEQAFDGTLERFLETLYVGGDFRLQTDTVNGRPVTVAVRGRWPFSDRAFADTAAHILKTERDFWGDNEFPHALVALIPTEANGGGQDNGVELTDAVAVYVGRSGALDYPLRFVLAHELFHTWNADKIRPVGEMHWFSEGFTDYYARLLLLRGGLISPAEYAAEVNRTLQDYWESPARAVRGEDAARGFYSGTEWAKLPYQQGALLAGHWNAELRAATADRVCLDDVMRDLLASSVADGADLTVDDVARAVRHYAPLDVAEDVRKGVEEGGQIDPDPHALGPGFALRTQRVPRFELGFDARALAERKVIAGVKPGSRAFWAGLRDGQEVVACSPFVLGVASQRVTITVRDGGGMNSRDIEFTPEGESLSVPQYVRDKAAADDRACLAWLGSGH